MYWNEEKCSYRKIKKICSIKDALEEHLGVNMLSIVEEDRSIGSKRVRA